MCYWVSINSIFSFRCFTAQQFFVHLIFSNSCLHWWHIVISKLKKHFKFIAFLQVAPVFIKKNIMRIT